MTEAPKCSECDGQLQATTKVYWERVDEGWVIVDLDHETVSLYCENDCGGTENDDEDRAVSNAVIALSDHLICYYDDIDGEGVKARQGRKENN